MISAAHAQAKWCACSPSGKHTRSTALPQHFPHGSQMASMPNQAHALSCAHASQMVSACVQTRTSQHCTHASQMVWRPFKCTRSAMRTCQPNRTEAKRQAHPFKAQSLSCAHEANGKHTGSNALVSAPHTRQPNGTRSLSKHALSTAHMPAKWQAHTFKCTRCSAARTPCLPHPRCTREPNAKSTLSSALAQHASQI